MNVDTTPLGSPHRDPEADSVNLLSEKELHLFAGED
jgi:hypothetical protein